MSVSGSDHGLGGMCRVPCVGPALRCAERRCSGGGEEVPFSSYVELHSSSLRNKRIFPPTHSSTPFSGLSWNSSPSLAPQDRTSVWRAAAFVWAIEGLGRHLFIPFRRQPLASPMELPLAKVAAVWQQRPSRMVKFQMSPCKGHLQELKSRIKMPNLKCPSNTCFPN